LSIPDALSAIQNNGLARAITKSNHLVIAGLQIVHVFGFLLLLASLLLMSLRLLGLALRQHSVPQVTRQPATLFAWGLALVIVSGALMFVTGPKHYFYNSAFEVKMLLLLAAALLHVTVFRSVAASESPNPLLARVAAVLSLILWFGIGIAGRAIGFV
jgi:hypothetical protein